MTDKRKPIIIKTNLAASETKKAAEAVRDGIRKKRPVIEIAPQDNVQRLEKEIDLVLSALGYPEALVTDWSTVNDFRDAEQDLARVSAELGVEVGADDYICEIAERLHRKG